MRRAVQAVRLEHGASGPPVCGELWPTGGERLRRSAIWLAAGAALALLALFYNEGSSPPAGGDPASGVEARASYDKLPLRFEPNRGQTDPEVKFLSRGAGYGLYLTSREAVLALSKPAPPARVASGDGNHRGGPPAAVIRMRPLGANPNPQLAAGNRLAGHSNYLTGSDATRWRTGVPGYASVTYRGVYPGVDLVYRGGQSKLEYDFVVAPGADPGTIAVGFGGARKLSLDSRGDLILHTAAGRIRQQRPFVYQRYGQARRRVSGRYVLEGKQRIGFRVGGYDRTRPLVIDPVLAYSTYLGGTDPPREGIAERGQGIAVDPSGSAFVTGTTSSTDFPTTTDAFRGANAGQADVFVTKLRPDGSGLAYSTYLGGSGMEEGTDIAVDASGAAYLTGSTGSANFPTSTGAYMQAGRSEAYVAKLSPEGALAYSTYLGGGQGARGAGIALEPSCASSCTAYVTGAFDIGFPTTSGAFQTTIPDGSFGGSFVTKLKADGSGLLYSTYLGDGEVRAAAIAVDSSGAAHVTGGVGGEIATTPGAFQPAPPAQGQPSTFVTKLAPDGSRLLYSTYLGETGDVARTTIFGRGNGAGQGIAVDGSGKTYVTGTTRSSNFPTTEGAFKRTKRDDWEGFVAKLDTAASGAGSLLYSTYLGGDTGGLGADDQLRGIGVDSAGQAYVAGHTLSPDFPVKDQVQLPHTPRGAKGDAFVSKLNASGSGLVYSTQLGGDGAEEADGIAVQPSGDAYVTGITAAPSARQANDFPWTEPGFQADQHGTGGDAFVAKLEPVSGPAPTVTGLETKGGPAGTEVVIRGTGFTGATAVRFGDAADPSFQVNSDTQITASAPPHGVPAGKAEDSVLVSVANASGSSRRGSLSRFTYHGWAETGMPSTGRYGHTATLLRNGKVLVVGGRNPQGQALASAELYDPKTGEWTRTADLPSNARYNHTATRLGDGRVLVAGGCCGRRSIGSNPNADAPIGNAVIYSPDLDPNNNPAVPRERNPWSSTGGMAMSRTAHSATVLPSGPPELCGANCGKVLLAGGYTEVPAAPSTSDPKVLTNSAELYDPGLGTFTPTGALQVPLAFHTATPLLTAPREACATNCGKVLVVGGHRGEDIEQDAPSEAPQLYDPVSGTWAPPIGEQEEARRFHTATLLPSGEVLIVGGRNSNLNNCFPSGDVGGRSTPLSLAEVYDPAALTPDTAFRGVANLSPGRFGHAAALLPNGQVLVAGGRPASTLDSALPNGQLFDEGSEVGIPAGFMRTTRDARGCPPNAELGPTATTLTNLDPSRPDGEVCGEGCGKVLVVGGLDRDGRAVASAELYAVPPTADEPGGGGGPGGADPGGTPGGGLGGQQGGPVTPQTGRPRAEGLRSKPGPGAGTQRRRSSRRRLSRCLRVAKRKTTKRRRTAARRRCRARYGPPRPGQIKDLRARALSSSEIRLTFSAVAFKGARPVRSYVIQQSSAPPVRGTRRFRRKLTLCGRACTFSPQKVGDRLILRVVELRPRTGYYYAVRARGRGGRLGPISNVARARTR